MDISSCFHCCVRFKQGGSVCQQVQYDRAIYNLMRNQNAKPCRQTTIKHNTQSYLHNLKHIPLNRSRISNQIKHKKKCKFTQKKIVNETK